MKADFTDVSETQKTISIEIPPDVVDAEIDRIARGYAKEVRLPGFRPGKAPGGDRQAAVPRADPPRRDARPGAARGGRSAAGARHRAGGLAQHQGRRDPRGPAADVHRRHPDGARRSIPATWARLRSTRVTTTVTDAAVDQALQRLRERGGEDGSRRGPAGGRRRHGGGRSRCAPIPTASRRRTPTSR